MKKIFTSTMLIASALLLVACSSNKNASTKVDKKDKTTLVSKKKTKAKKKASSKKKKSSNKQTEQSDNNKTDQSDTQQSTNSQQTQVSNAQSQQASNANTSTNQQSQQGQQGQQQSSGISYNENTLTGFLNKYGESPAAYKVDHGMSTLQALQSTPDSMKTFGEKQTQYGMETGRLNPDGSPADQYGY